MINEMIRLKKTPPKQCFLSQITISNFCYSSEQNRFSCCCKVIIALLHISIVFVISFCLSIYFRNTVYRNLIGKTATDNFPWLQKERIILHIFMGVDKPSHICVDTH